jgi:hypothetical protein
MLRLSDNYFHFRHKMMISTITVVRDYVEQEIS